MEELACYIVAFKETARLKLSGVMPLFQVNKVADFAFAI